MRRSFTGPLLMIVIGAIFLWRTLHPETAVFDLMAQYWPLLLIAWGFIRLIEVLIWHREGIRGSFSGGEIMLIILICVVGSGIWTAKEHGARFVVGGLDWWGQQYDYPVSATTSGTGMRRIVFENSRGNIKIVGSDSKDITIAGHKIIRAYSRADADTANSNTPIELVPQGDRVLVRTNQDRVPNNQRLDDDLEVTVPKSITVESRASSGDHDVTDLNGDVDITSGRSDVRLTRIGGNARLDVSRSGLIRATDVKGRLEIQGHGSDVELENIDGQVTINGDFSGNQEFKNLAKPLHFESNRGTELTVQAIPGRINMTLGDFEAKDVVGPVRRQSFDDLIKTRPVEIPLDPIKLVQAFTIWDQKVGANKLK